MPAPPTLHRHRLENGLQTVLFERHDRPLVAVNLWYHVGSKNETRGRTGLAHLFEHMLFQGSKHVAANEHFRHVQQVGGVANGSTWYDRTNYFETLPAHQLELGLWLESDRMGFLLDALTPEKLETQRSVVMNERRQRVDNRPYGRAVERLHELLYPAEHPYSWPVIGAMDDIAAATLDDVRGFFEIHYRPSNAVLTLVGDFETGDAIESVERWFAELPSAPAPHPLRHGLPPAPEPRHEVMEDDVGLPRVYLAATVPAYGCDEWDAAHLLTSILAGGKASRLHQDLVYRRQIAQEVSTYVFPTEECATFLAVATGREGVDPVDLAAALSKAIDDAGAAPPTEAERHRALRGQLAAFYSELQTYEGLADAIGGTTTYFDQPEWLWSVPERLEAVSPAAMAEVAGAHLAADRRVSVTVVPRGTVS
ncbi:MAG TPA: pitrilysin family protein [Thermoanaerobaculia bacterium]|nr:pitrilysin family protein [Thermoanaerobaculia bacterium]